MANDLISREAAIKEITALIDIEYGYEGIEDDVRRIFNALPAEVPVAPQWISVADRLPEDESPVLAYYHFSYPKMRYMGVLTYFVFDDNPHWQHELSGLVVTHWMPLPEAPERSEE